MRFIVRSRFGEICSFCFLSALHGFAWVPFSLNFVLLTFYVPLINSTKTINQETFCYQHVTCFRFLSRLFRRQQRPPAVQKVNANRRQLSKEVGRIKNQDDDRYIFSFSPESSLKVLAYCDWNYRTKLLCVFVLQMSRVLLPVRPQVLRGRGRRPVSLRQQRPSALRQPGQ